MKSSDWHGRCCPSGAERGHAGGAWPCRIGRFFHRWTRKRRNLRFFGVLVSHTKETVMRKIFASLLFTLAVIGLFLAQIDLASSFGFNFRRFNSGTQNNTSPSPQPSPSPVPSGFAAADPGVRAGAGAGDPIPGLSANQIAFFNAGKADFAAAEDVPDGLGPRMNLDSCGGCHQAPAVGGSSPAV